MTVYELHQVATARFGRRRRIPAPTGWARVLSTCPDHGQAITTQAVMTVTQFERLKTGLAIFCAHCRSPHLLPREALRLECYEPRNRSTRRAF